MVSGVHQALDLTARLLLDPGDRVWMEDPGYFGARAVLEAAELEIVPVRVDEQGLDVAHGAQGRSRARLVYTTPAHQSPLGSTLSLERRVELLGVRSPLRARTSSRTTTTASFVTRATTHRPHRGSTRRAR